MVKNLPAMQETWDWSLGWEDPLEDSKGKPSSTPAWRTVRTEEPGGLESGGSHRLSAWAQQSGSLFSAQASLLWGNHRDYTRLPQVRQAAVSSFSVRESLYLQINMDFFFMLSFHFLCLVLVIHIASSVFCIIKDNTAVGTIRQDSSYKQTT